MEREKLDTGKNTLLGENTLEEKIILSSKMKKYLYIYSCNTINSIVKRYKERDKLLTISYVSQFSNLRRSVEKDN